MSPSTCSLLLKAFFPVLTFISIIIWILYMRKKAKRSYLRTELFIKFRDDIRNEKTSEEGRSATIQCALNHILSLTEDEQLEGIEYLAMSAMKYREALLAIGSIGDEKVVRKAVKRLEGHLKEKLQCCSPDERANTGQLLAFLKGICALNMLGR
ncbi:MAG: hypothetical protein WCT28_03455 [Patescibacteria group bacterium]|jgi:hypothetical protein